MQMIINTTSMVPIYEQIVENIKRMIIEGELKNGDVLPSVRTLSKELKISALTVKKAYDCLEEEGYTATVHGKGTYVTGTNAEMLAEQRRFEIQNELEKVVKKAEQYGVSHEEIAQLLSLIFEE
ncbi:MAG: GntR family transcriptional regulator [Erysipelotrichaceae bacterium]|jgi:GntR family transcriptional regulator|nr:GntR family transcriptional regulator [Erysipelotrichaceae bacterium]